MCFSVPRVPQRGSRRGRRGESWRCFRLPLQGKEKGPLWGTTKREKGPFGAALHRLAAIYSEPSTYISESRFRAESFRPPLTAKIYYVPLCGSNMAQRGPFGLLCLKALVAPKGQEQSGTRPPKGQKLFLQHLKVQYARPTTWETRIFILPFVAQYMPRGAPKGQTRPKGPSGPGGQDKYARLPRCGTRILHL